MTARKRALAAQGSFGYESRVFAAAAAVAVAVVGGCAVLAALAGVDGGVISREPQVTLEGALYTGALSNLGALVWMVGVTLAAIGASMVDSDRDRLLFAGGATIGALLLIDDFFLVHDWLNTIHSELDTVLLASYGVAIVALLFRFWDELGPVGVGGLSVALGLFMFSAGLDTLLNDLDQLIEDGIKFVGIVIWSTTWTLLARPWMRTGQAA